MTQTTDTKIMVGAIAIAGFLLLLIPKIEPKKVIL